MAKGKLTSKVEINVRFSEVDSMGVVWHGNYVKYLEDGRESFGLKYNLGYYDVYNQGYMTPVVNLNIDYKKMVRYGEKIIIETEYIPSDAAKIIFKYKIYNSDNNVLILTAETTQIFIDKNGELFLTNPNFYINWKKHWGVI